MGRWHVGELFINEGMQRVCEHICLALRRDHLQQIMYCLDG